jgi:hypothetical protein
MSYLKKHYWEKQYQKNSVSMQWVISKIVLQLEELK